MDQLLSSRDADSAMRWADHVDDWWYRRSVVDAARNAAVEHRHGEMLVHICDCTPGGDWVPLRSLRLGVDEGVRALARGHTRPHLCYRPGRSGVERTAGVHMSAAVGLVLTQRVLDAVGHGQWSAAEPGAVLAAAGTAVRALRDRREAEACSFTGADDELDEEQLRFGGEAHQVVSLVGRRLLEHADRTRPGQRFLTVAEHAALRTLSTRLTGTGGATTRWRRDVVAAAASLPEIEAREEGRGEVDAAARRLREEVGWVVVAPGHGRSYSVLSAACGGHAAKMLTAVPAPVAMAAQLEGAAHPVTAPLPHRTAAAAAVMGTHAWRHHQGGGAELSDLAAAATAMT